MPDDATDSTAPSTLDLLTTMNAADAAVAPAVAMALPALGRVVDAVVERLRAGGRLFYVGAGTSGRLGVLDASEWYPTFGVEHGVANAVIAGGEEAVFRSIEGAEDSATDGARDLADAGARAGDVVIGISASGTTPYVLGALTWARDHAIFAGAVVCSRVAAVPADAVVEIPVGPEFVEGSSRLKAGTATKMALNLISTVAMIRLGRVDSGRMVHVRALNAKLRRRAGDMVAATAGVSPESAAELLAKADGDVKVAVVMGRLLISAEDARVWLDAHGSSLGTLPGQEAARPSAPVDLQAVFARYAEKPVRRVIGLMSGTSADGVHAALVELSGAGTATATRVVALSHEHYDADMRTRIFRLFDSDCPVAHVCEMDFVLGELFAQAALRLAQEHDGIQSIDLIASHGQTVCHLPTQGATLQIGEPTVIAERTGVTTVADFRVADVAAGGQGAPLTPYADYVLFRHAARGRAIQNIGGIANVTFLPAGCRLEEVIAFDTGPGNMLIDAVTAAVTDGRLLYDEGGRLAAAGQVHDGLLEWLMGHEFIRRDLPKTAGREGFGAGLAGHFLKHARELGLPPEDMVATVTAFTAESIADAYRRFLLPKGRIDEIILGGGGAYNETLKRWIAERLPGMEVHTHEDFGIPGHAKECLAFAILGNETMLGRASSLPNVTGARRAAVLGKVIPASPTRSRS